VADRSLRGCRILVAEDEYMLADDLCAELANAGAIVVGPAGTVEDVLELARSEPDLDGAILDINMRGEMVFPVAETLMERGVPFVFTTGYDASAIPPRFDRVVRCEKPIDLGKVAQALGRAIAT